MAIKIQHIGIYIVVREADRDYAPVDIMCAFYTQKDAEEYLQMQARKIEFMGGEYITQGDGYITVEDWQGIRITLWIAEIGLTTAEQLKKQRYWN